RRIPMIISIPSLQERTYNERFKLISISFHMESQRISKEIVVTPETKSQGLFHQIQKEVTFCGLPHGADA
ncbi:hypothetical protein ACQPUR_21310, partial [Clostridium neonatale]|uniref:hypothetical protein n=1 Tax=Clostridium neonatale TaxID=137838 RepID=UPI003D33F76F